MLVRIFRFVVFLRLNFFLLLVAASATAGTLFKPVQTFSSGGIGAGRFAVADLNKDGKADLIVPNGSGSVGVLLGKGDGSFMSPVSYPLTYLSPTAAAVADVNGDGMPDILVSISNCVGNTNGCVAVLLGNGDGSFRTAIYYDAGAPNTYSLAVADFNGDGKIDIAVADCSPFTGAACGLFGVMLGKGDGTFKPVSIYDSGGVGAWWVVTGDLNGDGKPDLVIGNLCPSTDCSPSTDGVVTVLLGKGDGTFELPVGYDSGGRTLVPTIADVNNDGIPDILVTNNKGGAGVGVLIGNGDGTFHRVVTYSIGSRHPFTLAIADVNGDSAMDVVVASDLQDQDSALVVFLGNGDGTFTRTTGHYNAGGVRSIRVVTADLDGDGRPDVLVGNCAPSGTACNGTEQGTVGVLLGAFQYKTTTVLTSSPNPSVEGQAVTLRATLTSSGPTKPTGAVHFKNGKSAIGSATLVAGVATFTTTKLPVGTLSLTAVYRGDTYSAKSISAVLTQTVNP